MRKPDAFARTVLSAGPPEQFEDAFVILLGDAAAVVGDVYVHATRRFARRDDDAPWTVSRQVLYGVVDHVADDLLDRQPVTHQ